MRMSYNCRLAQLHGLRKLQDSGSDMVSTTYRFAQRLLQPGTLLQLRNQYTTLAKKSKPLGLVQ